MFLTPVVFFFSDCNPEGPSPLPITARFAASAAAADIARHFTPPPIPPLPLASLLLSLPTSLLWKRFLCDLAGKRDSDVPCVKLTLAAAAKRHKCQCHTFGGQRHVHRRRCLGSGSADSGYRSGFRRCSAGLC